MENVLLGIAIVFGVLIAVVLFPALLAWNILVMVEGGISFWPLFWSILLTTFLIGGAGKVGN